MWYDYMHAVVNKLQKQLHRKEQSCTTVRTQIQQNMHKQNNAIGQVVSHLQLVKLHALREPC